MSTPALTPRAIEAAWVVSNHPGIARSTVALLMGCGWSTAGQHLYTAHAHGLASPRGRGRGARWFADDVQPQHQRCLPAARRVPSVWELAQGASAIAAAAAST